MQVCTSLQADNHASIPPLSFFYRPDALLPPNRVKALKAIKGNSANSSKNGRTKMQM